MTLVLGSGGAMLVRPKVVGRRVGEVAGGRERLPEGAGGRREPEQRWPTGPCTRTNPALVTGIIRRQTLQGARIVEESMWVLNWLQYGDQAGIRLGSGWDIGVT